LKELKRIMMSYPQNITQSQKNKNRIIVTCPNSGLHYILEKQKEMHCQKEVFVPVTVLAPGMKFINEGLLTVQQQSEGSFKDIQPKIIAKDEEELN
jgi:hypothetical protein